MFVEYKLQAIQRLKVTQLANFKDTIYYQEGKAINKDKNMDSILNLNLRRAISDI